jgi:lysyl-tRNA synthetase, class I
MAEKHWADKVTEKLVKVFPQQKEYIAAAGISPSGTVHIGNFRDIITSELIIRSLKDKKKKSKLIFIWDDYDRLRKVPPNLPKTFKKYLGMPLSEIPNPNKKGESYADFYKKELEGTMPELGIEIEFISQSDEYKKNKYYKEIKLALQKREEIARILASFKTQGMTEKEIKEYYPLQVYCSKCKKDTTWIENYDGDNLVTYECKCGHKEEADISKKNIGKLQWKVDWAARWRYYGVTFEPGGTDHSTPGGSYDISKRIAKEIFGITPPFFEGYAFVGITGVEKMSSSSGTGISPKALLGIYEPAILRWFFARIEPKKTITLCFDSELIRQYNMFDRILDKHFAKELSEKEERILEFASPGIKWPKIRVPFRQVTSFGQIAQGNLPILKKMFDNMGQKYDDENLKLRMEKSQTWVNNFAKDLQIKVRSTQNKTYHNKLTNEKKEQMANLVKELDKNWDLEKLTTLVYSIPKDDSLSEDENKKRQREFFKTAYQLMIDNDIGPRLPTFMLALGKVKVKKLLNF